MQRVRKFLRQKSQGLILVVLVLCPAPAFAGWMNRLKECAANYLGFRLGRPLAPLLTAAPPVSIETLEPDQRVLYGNVFKSVQSHYPNSQTILLANGGESFVFLVTPPNGPQKIVRVPNNLNAKRNARTLARYEQELQIVEAAKKEDVLGGRRLVQSSKIVNIGTENLPAGALETEYVPGGTLQNNINIFGPNASDRQILLAYRDLALGIRSLHRAKWIHMDLKPENILMRQTPGGGVELLIADYGLAAPKNGRALGLAQGKAAGTGAYMSPLQAAGYPATERFDLYSTKIIFQIMQKGQLWDAHPESLEPTRTEKIQHPGSIRVMEGTFRTADELLSAIDRELETAPE